MPPVPDVPTPSSSARSLQPRPVVLPLHAGAFRAHALVRVLQWPVHLRLHRSFREGSQVWWVNGARTYWRNGLGLVPAYWAGIFLGQS